MKRVLIIVDDADIRTLIAIFVEHLGYAVDEAADLPQALTRIRLNAPDAVIVMPHPRRLPARTFVAAYVEECGRQAAVQPAPVALIMADAATAGDFGPPVRAVLGMPFSLDELASTAWLLVEPAPAYATT